MADSELDYQIDHIELVVQMDLQIGYSIVVLAVFVLRRIWQAHYSN